MTALLAEVLAYADQLPVFDNLTPFLLGMALTGLVVLGLVVREARIARSRARSRMIRRPLGV